jgi:hypothetical protein
MGKAKAFDGSAYVAEPPPGDGTFPKGHHIEFT